MDSRWEHRPWLDDGLFCVVKELNREGAFNISPDHSLLGSIPGMPCPTDSWALPAPHLGASGAAHMGLPVAPTHIIRLC